MKVQWSRRALLDVEHIQHYIAEDSPAYARPFIEQLLRATRHLPQFPHSGRAMPEANDPAIREVIFQGYRIIYRINSGCVEVITVVHGSRNITGPDVTMI